LWILLVNKLGFCLSNKLL